MDVIAYPNTAYNNASYNLAYHGYANRSVYERNPAISKAKKGQGKGLVAAVVILVILLLMVIAALIVVVVLYQQKGQTQVTTTVSHIGQSQITTTVTPSTTTVGSNPTTIIDFSVTRTDLTYKPEMADSKSPTFVNTCNSFCDMICNSWLMKKVSTDDCSCYRLHAGSVIADIRLTDDGSLGTPQYVLELARQVIPMMSEKEENTPKVLAPNIVLHGVTTTTTSTDSGQATDGVTTTTTSTDSGQATDGDTTTSQATDGDTTTSQATVPPEPTVTIGMNITRNDLTFESEMDNPSSAIFKTTNGTFCKMIFEEWAKGTLKHKDCKCVKFASGSIAATVHADIFLGTDTAVAVLTKIRGLVLPIQKKDTRINKIVNEDIFFG